MAPNYRPSPSHLGRAGPKADLMFLIHNLLSLEIDTHSQLVNSGAKVNQENPSHNELLLAAGRPKFGWFDTLKSVHH